MKIKLLFLIVIFLLFINTASAQWEYDTGWLDPFNYASQNQHGLCNNGKGGYCGAHQEGWTSCSDYSQNVYDPFWCSPNDCGSDKYREFILRLSNVPSNYNDCKISILGDYGSETIELIRFTHSYNGNNAVRTIDISDAGNGDPLEVIFPDTFSFQAGTNYLHFKHPEFCKQERGGSVHVRNFRVQCGEFQIPPPNRDPTINIPDQIIAEDSGPVIAINDLNTVANDPDGDILIFTVTNEDFFVDCEILGNSLILTPFPDFFGISTCTVQADDGRGGTDSSTFNINVNPINDAPVIDGIPDQNLIENSGFNDNIIDLWLYSFDIETPVPLLLYTIISQTNPSVVDCIVDAFGFVDCDVQPNQIGFSDVTVEVSDGDLTDTDIFRVNVNPVSNNDPVWITNLPDAFLNEDFGSVLYISNLLNSVIDPDNDTISFSVVNENPSEVDCEINGNQLILNSVLNWNGVTSCTIRADDGNGGTADDLFLIIVNPVNDNPTAVITSPNNNSSYDYGDNIIFIGNAFDVEDGTLTGNNLQWTSNLDGNIGSGEFFNLNNLSRGIHTITLTATDSNGGTGIYSITITINPIGGTEEEEEEEAAEKEHSLRIDSINMPSTVNCGERFTLNLEIENNGDYNEYDIYTTVKNSVLKIDEKSSEIDIKKNNEKILSLVLKVPENIEKNIYTLAIRLYFGDGDLADTSQNGIEVVCKKIELKDKEGIVISDGIKENIDVRIKALNILEIITLIIAILLIIIIIIYLIGKI